MGVVKLADKHNLTYEDFALGTFGAEAKKNGHKFIDWRVANIICKETAQGRSIRDIFKRHQGEYGWPDDETKHFLWLRSSEKYRTMYYAAQEDRSELHIEKMLDLMEKVADGGIGVNEARLISENLRWAAGKFNQKRYGERQQKDETQQKSIVFQFNLGNAKKDDIRTVEAIEAEQLPPPEED